MAWPAAGACSSLAGAHSPGVGRWLGAWSYVHPHLFGLLGGLDEQVRLVVGFLDSGAGYVEILGLDFDSYKFSPQIGAGYASGAAAHEGVENCLGKTL